VKLIALDQGQAHFAGQCLPGAGFAATGNAHHDNGFHNLDSAILDISKKRNELKTFRNMVLTIKN
jgi:hypothetical protein